MEKQKSTLNEFTMLTLLGVGNYAKVVLVRKKSNGKHYAMKIVKKADRQKHQKSEKDHAFTEKRILSQCIHPFIVGLHSTFQQQQKLYYILEYCPGGELFGLIKRHKRFSQESSRFYAAQILMAVEFLHKNKVIFREYPSQSHSLKPENVLIDAQGYIRLIDFGLSILDSKNQPHSNYAGTPEYLPPQAFGQKSVIGYESDWWCLGSIIFEMMAGFPPFFVQKQNLSNLNRKIEFQEPPLYLINSPLLKDLLIKLLEKNPKKRLGSNGAQEVKNHPWFKIVPWEKLLQKDIKPPFVPKLKSEYDATWFDLQNEGAELVPSDDEVQSVENYHEFSLSWKSSDRAVSASQDASPTEITFNVEVTDKA